MAVPAAQRKELDGVPLKKTPEYKEGVKRVVKLVFTIVSCIRVRRINTLHNRRVCRKRMRTIFTDEGGASDVVVEEKIREISYFP